MGARRPRHTPPPADTGPAAPEAARGGLPDDPRKHPQVVAALKRARRGDPAADPLKPVGRTSFIVLSPVLLGGAVFAGLMPAAPAAVTVAQGAEPGGFTRYLAQLAAFFTPVTDRVEAGFEALSLDRVLRADLDLDTGFALIVSAFTFSAAYYALVYLIGLTALKRLGFAGRYIYNDALKPLGRAALARTGGTVETLKRKRRDRHGPDPDKSLYGH